MDAICIWSIWEKHVSLRVFASSGWSDGKGADGSDRAYGV